MQGHSIHGGSAGKGADNMKNRLFVALIVLVIISGFSSAIEPRILHVPGEYTNIQTAIDEAEDGDIVIIAPGTYVLQSGERYIINGKQITISSSDPEDPCVVAVRAFAAELG